MVRCAIANTLVASVPVTEVGPTARSRGGSCATATPAPPATTRRASRSTASWRRTTASAVPGTGAPPTSDGRPAEREHAHSEGEQVESACGRLALAGRQAQRTGRRTAAVGRLAGGVEPVARGRVLPRRVAAVVLAAGQEPGVLHSEARRAHRPAGGA